MRILGGVKINVSNRIGLKAEQHKICLTAATICITLVPISANYQQDEQIICIIFLQMAQISVSLFQNSRHFAHFLKQRRLPLNYIKAIQSGTYGALAKKRRVRLGEERLNIERSACKNFFKKFVPKLLTSGQTGHII